MKINLHLLEYRLILEYQGLFSSIFNNQSKQEEKQNLIEKGNEQKTVIQSLFTTTNIQRNQNNIFSTNNNDKSKSIFFENNSNNLNIKKTEIKTKWDYLV